MVKWGKYAKIFVKILKNRLFLADLCSYNTQFIYPRVDPKDTTCLRFPKISMLSTTVEQIFLELFSFKQGTYI